MRKILTRNFFNRSTLLVAQELLGKYIVKDDGRELMITEVEAYDGPLDRASHAARGRSPRTGRAAVMFGEAGRLYIFFTYGMHWMANVVTGPKEYPAAVLLRGGCTQEGRAIKGPARLTKFLGIQGTINGVPARRARGLWFEDRGVKVPPADIRAAKRVGIEYAGPRWARKKYNFSISCYTMGINGRRSKSNSTGGNSIR